MLARPGWPLSTRESTPELITAETSFELSLVAVNFVPEKKLLSVRVFRVASVRLTSVGGICATTEAVRNRRDSNCSIGLEKRIVALLLLRTNDIILLEYNFLALFIKTPIRSHRFDGHRVGSAMVMGAVAVSNRVRHDATHR